MPTLRLYPAFALALIIIIAGFIGACQSKQQNDSIKQTLLVQALPDSLVLKSVIDAMPEVMNTIIKEELGLEKNYNFDFFLPKKLLRLTLYYINDMNEDGENIVFSTLDAIEKNSQKYTAQQIAFGSQVDFFGDDKDELVIVINDPDKELSRINHAIKENLHQANKEYRRTQNHDLYDITTSERNPYLPHIGLGRIRYQSIRQHIKDASQVEDTLNRIRSRIKEASLRMLKERSALKDQKLPFNKIGILNLHKQTYIKEYALK